ncbi:MAG: hypothetical protein SCH66_14270 [Methanolobus sp.]|nr:hypothetical protein [Methanolobus sp.]
MKYTFQDSTELPFQRDFIKDLQDFLKISKEIIPLENAATNLNEMKKKDMVSVETRIKEIDEFETGIITAVRQKSASAESLNPTGIVDETIAAIASISSKKKTDLEKQLEESVKTADYQIQQLNHKMISILNPFFQGGIYDSVDTYSFLQEDRRTSGKQISFAENMEYWFDLEFNTNELKVDDLYEKFSLPVWVSGGLLHHENKVKDMDLSDYLITSMNYDGDEHLEAVIRDNKSEHLFKIVADENTFIIFHNDKDITIDEDLAKSIEDEEVLLLINKMKQYFSVAVQSSVLTHLFIDGKDAISENRVLDYLKIIAAKYGALVNECFAKGYNKEEITIKIERPDETRTEKYISKSDAFNQLSDIGPEGLELAGLLNVAEN